MASQTALSRSAAASSWSTTSLVVIVVFLGMSLLQLAGVLVWSTFVLYTLRITLGFPDGFMMVGLWLSQWGICTLVLAWIPGA
jgi:hypothetical protein